jgi:hypothetical protein
VARQVRTALVGLNGQIVLTRFANFPTQRRRNGVRGATGLASVGEQTQKRASNAQHEVDTRGHPFRRELVRACSQAHARGHTEHRYSLAKEQTRGISAAEYMHSLSPRCCAAVAPRMQQSSDFFSHRIRSDGTKGFAID